MTNKEKLELISNVEELKNIVLKSFSYKDDLLTIPHSLKNSYSEIFSKIKQNSNYQNFPLLINLLKADSLVKCITSLNKTFKDIESIDMKKLWSDIYEHSISEINLNTDISTLPTTLDGKMIGEMKNHIKITKLQLSNFRFFVDEEKNNTFEINNKNMLLYGENGSGKSSLFKAFEFLSKISKENVSKEFSENKNIYKLEENSSIIFEFNNGETLEINDDSETNHDLTFINNLSVFMPMLNYKNLLDISYEKKGNDNNLYDFFETILKHYPIADGKTLISLKEEEDERYFDIFEEILISELFDKINLYLNEFEQDFQLTQIKFNKVFQKITLDIDLFDKNINKYSSFLNEARLSSLAISVYFAIIEKQFELLEEDSLKILVLDDLLISLDMNNRLSLINILKNNFNDFQIFFFTHDKSLYEVIKGKFKTVSYELYVDIFKNESEKYEVPFLKKSNSLFEQAKYHKLQKEYDCCANKLRQYTEELLCKILPPEDLINKNCKQLDLSAMINKAIINERKKSDGNKIIIYNFEKLQTYRKILFNPSSHYDDTDIYKKELEDTIATLEDVLNAN